MPSHLCAPGACTCQADAELADHLTRDHRGGRCVTGACLPKPYYEDSAVQIFHADCRDVLPQIEPAQLIVTSPPYNVQRDYGNGTDDRLPIPEYQEKLRGWIRVMAAALRPGGTLALNLPGMIRTRVNAESGYRGLKGYQAPDGIDTLESDHRGYPIGAWATIAVAEELMLRETIVWVKGPRDGEAYATSLAMGNVANPFFRPAHEVIILASKERYNRDGTMGRLHPSGERIDWLKDVWHVSASSAYGARRSVKHPCPFPPAIPSRLILLFSEPGDLVIDPFMGSGTTVFAAKKLGRRVVGIDIEESYCRDASQKATQAVLPLGGPP